MIVEHDVSLLPYNTFGIDVRARRLVHVEGVADLEALASQVVGPAVVLGRGSNVVPLADFDGTAVVVDMKSVSYDGDCVEAEAGVVWDDLVAGTLANGLYGLENLSAIPGTVGASVVQNIGAYGVEAKDFVESVTAYDMQSRSTVRFSAAECRFGYRDSLFKQAGGRFLVVRVRYRLSRAFVPRLGYAALRDLPCGSAAELREAIAALRWQKLPRPEEHGSAGSFFKNPVVDQASLDRLLAEHPDMPSHGLKLNAAWLIDRAGWKGRTVGRAGVWPRQALVLYNTGGCTGAEVRDLARAVRDDVERRFGVRLEPEAVFVGRDGVVAQHPLD